MRAAVLALALAAVLAAITHIVVVFMVPDVAPAGLEADLPPMESGTGFFEVSDASLFADRDPAMRRRVCAIDLRDGAVRVSAAVPSGYWSVSVHDRIGLAYAALNDRAAQGGELSVILATRRQERALSSDEIDGATVIRVPALRGYVLLRALVDRPSREGAVSAALDGATCRVTPVDLPPVEPQTLDELIAQAAPSS